MWQNAFRDFGEDLKTAPYAPSGCISPDHPSYLLLVNSPDFQIQRVVQESEAGKTLHKMFFRYRTTRPKEPTIEGWLRLDPSMNWALQSYEFDNNEGKESRASSDRKKQQRLDFHYSGSLRYQVVNGVAVPSEVKFVRTTNGNLSKHDTYTLSEFAITTTPPGEFSLAAIGLGDVEHTLAEVKTRNAYGIVGLTAVALAAFFVSVLLFRKGRAIQKSRRKSREDLSPDQPPGSLASEQPS